MDEIAEGAIDRLEDEGVDVEDDDDEEDAEDSEEE
jgi:hypothetical protein